MRVRDLTWMQLEQRLARDDRIVLPLGSTEQHAYLSLETDNIPRKPAALRVTAGDGSYGGRYERSDDEVLEVWRVGVEETRAVLEGGWS